MKYDFALDFTPEGVRLLQGSGKDAVLFGSVAFGDPHFETRVEDLRKEAEELHGGPFATALLLPHSEVLFHTMKVEEGTEVTEEKVRAELEGLTPYDVSDLAFDWKSLSKTQVEIAAVARETLAEADAFAGQHGFGPGPFSTPPNPKAFRGQPSFGTSDRPMPQPKAVPAPEPVAEVPAPVAAPAAAPKGPEAPRAAPVPSKTEAAPADAAPASAQSDDAVTTAKADPSPAGRKTGEAPAVSKADEGSADPKPTAPKAADAPVVETKPAAKPAETTPDKAETPVPGGKANANGADQTPADTRAEPKMSAKPSGPAPAGTPKQTGPAKSGTAADTKSEGPPPSFSSRRSSGPAAGAGAASVAVGAAGMATAATASRLGSITGRAAGLPDGGTGPVETPGNKPNPDMPKAKAAPVPPQRRTTAPAVGKPSGRGAAPGRVSPTPTVRKVDTPESVSGAAKSLATSPDSANPKPPLNEAEALTVFGMRGTRKSPASAVLPIVIGLLVAALLALAAWSAFAYFSSPRDTAPEVEQGAVLPEQDGEQIAALSEDEPANDALPAEDETVAVDAAPAEDIPASDTAEADATEIDVTAPEEPAPVDTATPDPAAEPGPDDPLRRSQDAPEATRYAATGVSTDAPSGSDTPAADSPEVESAARGDSTIRVQDGVAQLESPELAALAAPDRLAPPPPPGARFELNEDGRVIATPEGTLSPQGVRITSGQPAVVPPSTPARPDAVTETTVPVDESEIDVPVTGGEPEAVPPARPEASVATEEDEDQAATPAPLARPEDIAVTRRASLDDDAITGEDDAAADLDVATDGPQDTPEGVVQSPSEADLVLAALSPRARPERPAADTAEPELPQISEEQSAAQAEAVASAIAAIVPGLEEATEEAVSTSLRPDSRPANFARTVERTQEAQPVRVAAASATVTPRNPTTGSVASRATEDNAIRLNRVNLIGVYGTQSNRRALIRLPSGQFVKVKIGDRVDGGRVSAIGSDRLQYVKGGQQVVLTIPAG